MGDMTTSPRGLYALALHEGIVPAPYRDSVGVWTYGIGHTAAAGFPDPRSLGRGMPGDLDAEIQTVIALFRRDLAQYEVAVRKAVEAPIAQHEFDALVSFHYNTGAIASAKLTGYLNAGKREQAARAFMNWVKPPELRKRREAERALFTNGTYPSGTVTVWGVNAFGRVLWDPVKRIGMDEFLALMSEPAPAVEHTKLRIADLPLVLDRLGIMRLQKLLGVAQDGKMGKDTYRALLERVEA
jgi:lysozyme